jgi:hypothetical protein
VIFRPSISSYNMIGGDQTHLMTATQAQHVVGKYLLVNRVLYVEPCLFART